MEQGLDYEEQGEGGKRRSYRANLFRVVCGSESYRKVGNQLGGEIGLLVRQDHAPGFRASLIGKA